MAIPNFGQMRELYSLQKKAKAMQKELKGLEIEARSADGAVTVVVAGDMKLRSVSVDEQYLTEQKKMLLEKTLVDVANQALAKAQSESATRMGPMLKDLNIPGM